MNSSPRVWGWTVGGTLRGRHTPLVPTCVGVDRKPGQRPRASATRPHVCGGGPTEAGNLTTPQCSSPRVWGWTPKPRSANSAFRLVPTCVGVDPGARRRGAALWPRPHVCGGGPFPRPQRTRAVRSSPRVWGWTHDPTRSQRAVALVPTCVGVDLERAHSPASSAAGAYSAPVWGSPMFSTIRSGPDAGPVSIRSARWGSPHSSGERRER